MKEETASLTAPVECRNGLRLWSRAYQDQRWRDRQYGRESPVAEASRRWPSRKDARRHNQAGGASGRDAGNACRY